MLNRRAVASALAAVVPIPGIDLGTDIAIMLQLLPAINRKFGLSPEQIDELDEATRVATLLIISSMGRQFVSKVITEEIIMLLLLKAGIRVTLKRMIRFIPIAGQIVSAGISFSAMKYLGNQLINDCAMVCERVIRKS
ncbi:MAG: hypothetical protein WDZ91_03650 [Paenibacillaceae bacterium]